jgi:tetratricopeptide (TPR) repeat protein
MGGPKLDFDLTELGSLLRQFREKKGFTQQHLGKLVGVSAAVISFVERGKKKVGENKLSRLFQEVGLSQEKIPELLQEKVQLDNLSYDLAKVSLTAAETAIDYGHLREGWNRIRDIEEVIKKSNLLALVEYLKGKYFFRKENWTKSHTHFQYAISICQDDLKSLRLLNIEAASYYELGRCHSQLNELQQALRCIEKGLSVFSLKGERQSTKYVLLISKVIYLEKLERDTEAENILTAMWPEIDKIDTETKLNMYQSKVNLLNKHKLFIEAIEFAEIAIDLARREKNYDRSFEMWTTLGSIYKDLGNLEMAKVCFKTAQVFESQIRKKYLPAYNYTELGKLYSLISDLTQAESYLTDAVRLSKVAGDAFHRYQALKALSECLWLQNKPESLEVLEQAYHLAKKHSFQNQEQDSSLKLAQYYQSYNKEKHDFYTKAYYQISLKLAGGENEMLVRNQVGDPPDN